MHTHLYKHTHDIYSCQSISKYTYECTHIHTHRETQTRMQNRVKVAKAKSERTHVKDSDELVH